MKFENNWKYKTLENLEKDTWSVPPFNSHLVTRTHQLRTIPLNEFSIEDLRIMIGQSMSLKYLIPLALGELKANALAEGNMYPGDLLVAVTKSDPEFWKENSHYKDELKQIIAHNADLIAVNNLTIS